MKAVRRAVCLVLTALVAAVLGAVVGGARGVVGALTDCGRRTHGSPLRRGRRRDPHLTWLSFVARLARPAVWARLLVWYGSRDE